MSRASDTEIGRKASGGLLSSISRLATKLLLAGKTRLELLGNEIEEEKLRAIRLLVLSQSMMFCFGVGTVLAFALLAALFWDSRIAVLALGAIFFLAVGIFILSRFQRAMQRPEAVFAASIAELQEDLRQLKEAATREAANR